MEILFVCTGNTCRSRMAEELSKDILKKRGCDIKISSAGTNITEGEKTANDAILVLRQFGLKPKSTKAKAVNYKKLSKYNFVICMSERHKQEIKKQYLGNNIYTMGEFTDGQDISDPYGLGYSFYKECAKELKQKLEVLFNKIITIG